jgi:hypothetical protein
LHLWKIIFPLVGFSIFLENKIINQKEIKMSHSSLSCSLKLQISKSMYAWVYWKVENTNLGRGISTIRTNFENCLDEINFCTSRVFAISIISKMIDEQVSYRPITKLIKSIEFALLLEPLVTYSNERKCILRTFGS